jgi:hypothetical protein
MSSLIAKALRKGTDYGKIPGTPGKDVLLKPGAEMVLAAFGCRCDFEVLEKEVNHDYQNIYTDKYGKKHEAIGLYRYVTQANFYRDNVLLGSAIGSASSLEAKYQNRPRDVENTVLKISCKRAMVAGVLIIFGLSDRFTQDIEDQYGKGDDVIDGETGEVKLTTMEICRENAKKAGIDATKWTELTRSLDITNDKRTQTPVRMKALADLIEKHTAAKTSPKELPEDALRKLEGGLLGLFGAWDNEEALIFCSEVTDRSVADIKTLTKEEYEKIVKAIDARVNEEPEDIDRPTYEGSE